MAVPGAPNYRQMAIDAAKAAGIDPSLFVQQIQAESGFNPNAVSPAGAQGIAQFMPATAQGLGVNPWNPQSALTGAAKMDAANLKQYGGDYSKMLAAYNCGSGCLANAVSQWGSNWLSHVPSETQNYVSNILRLSGNPKPPSTTPTPTPTSTGSSTGASYPTSCAPWDFQCTLAMIVDSNTTRNIVILIIAIIILLMGVEIMFKGGGSK